MATHLSVVPLDIIHALNTPCDIQRLNNAGLSFIRLPHPRTGVPSLFASPGIHQTLLEVQAVNPLDSRSWFLDKEVVSDGKLLIITPIDPVFLLIPILQAVHPTDGSPGTYRPADDIFEEASVKLGSHGAVEGAFNEDILYFGSLDTVRDSLKQICEGKEIAPGLTVYRFSNSKVQEYLRMKVSRLAVSEVLGASRALVRKFAKDGLMEDEKENLLRIAHIRATCDLLAQYLSPELRAALLTSYDFTQLDSYLRDQDATVTDTSLATGKKANAKTSDTDKKRKNAKDSHGVERLKRANVVGMPPLTTFFKKA